MQENQLVPQLLMKQPDDTLPTQYRHMPTQYRHIEHLHEGV